VGNEVGPRKERTAQKYCPTCRDQPEKAIGHLWQIKNTSVTEQTKGNIVEKKKNSKRGKNLGGIQRNHTRMKSFNGAASEANSSERKGNETKGSKRKKGR